MSTENPNNFIAKIAWKVTPPKKEWDAISSKVGRQINGENVTQSESQKFQQISLILAIIDKNGPIKTSSIRDKTGLSWDCITSTLKLFRDKKIVRMIQYKDRQNNAKYYTLDRTRAIAYHHKIVSWKRIKFKIKPPKISLCELKLWDNVGNCLPDGWEDGMINLTPEAMNYLHKKENRIKIQDLSPPIMNRIMLDYYNRIYCKDCFREGNIVIVERTMDNKIVCPLCKHESDYEEEYIPDLESFRKWKNEKENGRGQIRKQLHRIEKNAEKHTIPNWFLFSKTV